MGDKCTYTCAIQLCPSDCRQTGSDVCCPTPPRSFLQVHQLEQESLSVQMRECKRNSRLGLLYELDKQVKVIERFMRRLEFHLSKVDELYETYCMQRRLRDGANKMIKAYSSSPSSREARESLMEATKGYREYTEGMCLLESELEALLGEFHVKMKGLAGFARLCAGDQYEIFMKYGRQRWKLRGRIEVNSRQVWDSEEMVFMPLVTDFLSIKVTELKSLASHVVVGSVSCETKDLFTAQPQMVAVDINDLGTVKLSLEVTWNPFDKDDQMSSGTISKAATVNRRLPSYNQTPPDTPALREQVFCRLPRRQEDMDSGTAWSCSSESSDDSSSPQSLLGVPHIHKNVVQPEICAALPAIQISFTPCGPTACTHPEESEEEEEESEASIASRQEDSGKQAVPNGHAKCYCPLSCEASSCPTLGSCPDAFETARLCDVEPLAISETSPAPPLGSQEQELSAENQGVFTLSPATMVVETGAKYPSVEVETSLVGVELCSNAFQTEDVSQEVNAPDWKKASPAPAEGMTQTQHHLVLEAQPMDSAVGGVQETLKAVLFTLGTLKGQFPELQGVEQQLKQLEETMMDHSHSTGVTLTVEDALGSFDFLKDEYEDENPNQGAKEEGEDEQWIPADSEFHGNPFRLGEDNGYKKDCQGALTEPMTTGCQALDHALMVHLRNCNSQLQTLHTSGMNHGALDQLLREARVLELIYLVTKDSNSHANSPMQGVLELERCHGAASLWKQCTGSSDAYTTSAESFLRTLIVSYEEQLGGASSCMTNTVLLQLVERIMGHQMSQDNGRAAGEPLTIFQFWNYLESEGVSSLDAHICEMAEEAEGH
ncbi:rho family-interacting cell polarization regulator 2-like isoform X1 [Scleropages formosus]|uniref:rho family-interacting cell polarization regulator 2-like isoform X1 n=1 Tax=Scleropages formosus TaxID=113540 RepID=UPI000878D07D|nr:rho family-interacting cell polarization regulator 2-like isoform X1 [Scleropages formosus]